MADPKFEDTSPVDFDDTVALDETPSFDDTVDVDAPVENKKPEAFLGGAFQDLTLGSMDELKGIVEAAGQSVGIKGLGQEFGKQELQTPLLMSDKTLGEAYKEGRDLERERIADLEAQEGGAFQAGEVAGMLGPIAATGGLGAMKGLLTTGTKEAAKRFLKKGAEEGIKRSTKKDIAKLAGSGALTGGGAAAGFSETEALEDPLQLAEEAATGAGIGAGAALAVPGATNLSTKALKAAGKGLREGSKQVAAIMAGLKKGDVDEILKRADDIKVAVDYPEIQEIVMDKTRGVLSQIEKLGRESRELLPAEKSIAKEAIRDRIDKRISKIATTADDSAVPHLQKIKEFIDNPTKFEGELISLQDVQKITQDIGKRAYRGVAKDAPGAVQKQLREAYHEMSEVLKGAAGDNYRKLAKEISERYNKLEQLDKKLGIKVDYDDVVLQSEDKLVRKLQEVGKTDPTGKEKADIENLLTELEELSGKKMDDKSLSDLLRARRLQGELDKGASEYSYAARTLTGGLAGSAAPGVGNVIGAAAGLASRPLSRAMLKRSGKLNKLNISKKTSEAVDRAAKNGAPLGLAAGISSGAKVAVSDSAAASKLEDPKYLEGLVKELKDSDIPGNQVYANQLEKYGETDDQQQKTQIQFNLSQQPAFRELLKEYDKTKK